MKIILLNYHVSIRGGQDTQGHVCDATVKFKLGGKTYHVVAEGNGPVHAVDKAIRTQLLSNGKKCFALLSQLSLENYEVRTSALNGTASETEVTIHFKYDGEGPFEVVRRSDNLVEASVLALVEGMNRVLRRKRT